MSMCLLHWQVDSLALSRQRSLAERVQLVLFSSSPTAGFLFLSLKSDLPVDMCARKTERVGRKGERERKKVKETGSR